MRLRSVLTFSPSTLLRTSMLVVVLLAGCAPATAPEPAQPETPAPAEAEPSPPLVFTATVSQLDTTPTEAPPTQAPPSEAPTEIPQIVATSRGPDLEATNPTMVSLSSGELQLVEFFRFT